MFWVAIAMLAIIGTIIPNTIYGDRSEALVIKNPLESLSVTSSKEEIIMAIRYVSRKYLIDESEFMAVIKCESNFRIDALGDSGKAFGLLQFHKSTFDQYCKGDYHSPKDQLSCGASMFQTPKLKLHWTCWKMYISH